MKRFASRFLAIVVSIALLAFEFPPVALAAGITATAGVTDYTGARAITVGDHLTFSDDDYIKPVLTDDPDDPCTCIEISRPYASDTGKYADIYQHTDTDVFNPAGPPVSYGADVSCGNAYEYFYATQPGTYHFSIAGIDLYGSVLGTISITVEVQGGDTTPPSVSDKTITASSVTASGAVLSWNKATDDTSAQTALQYLVYRSGSNNLGSVANIETNGTAQGSYATDISSKSIAGLSGGTTYYFNIIAKDGNGNKTCYTTKQVTTNVAPSFVGSTTAISVDENSAASDVKALLHASDTDSGQTLTWSQYTAPSHGTLTVTGTTASTGSSDITPSGTITYAPNTDYCGTDSFAVQVGDGTDTATRTITVHVLQQLAMPSGLAWDSTTPGKAKWDAVSHASAYSVQLYCGGIAAGSAASVPSGTEYDFTSGITGTYGPGVYTFTVIAKGDGNTYKDSTTSGASAEYHYNHTPAFVGSTTALTIDENSAASDVKALLHAGDTDSGQTLIWSQSVAPSHGILTITGTAASSGSSDITPGGTVTYTPDSGYCGSDSFAVRVSDGMDTATRTISVSVQRQLAKPDGLRWDIVTPGKAEWNVVSGASGYSVQLYKGGSAAGGAVSVLSGTSYDFTSVIAATYDPGVYTFTVTAKGDGSSYKDSSVSDASGGYRYNHTPAFVGNTTALAVDVNSAACDVKSLLHVNDSDGGQTLTWSQTAAPSHGTLTVTSTAASSGSADITPGGTVTYTPDTGYFGSDSFTVQVSDGMDTATRTITVSVARQLAKPSGLAWDATTPGKATWSAVTGASGYSVQLYKGGAAQGGAISVSAGTEYDFTGVITAGGNGLYTFKVTAVAASGSYDRDSVASDASAEYDYNHVPAFVGSSTSLSVVKGTSDIDAKGLLHVNDVDSSQTLTWSQKTAPGHGALTITGATASTGFSDIAPGGTITYTPAAGYCGPDSFTVQVSDGKAAVTRTISVLVTATLAIPTGLAWDSTTPGKAKWDAVDHADSYSVQLCKGGNALGAAQSVAAGTTAFDFTGMITSSGSGVYSFSVTAEAAGGSYYGNSAESAPSAGYHFIAPTLADAAKNSVSAAATGITLGASFALSANGDRQNAVGLAPGDERYIPVTWASTETGKTGSFVLGGGAYGSAYTPSAAGSFTVTAIFRKQVFNGTSWADSSETATKTIILTVSPNTFTVRFEDWNGTLLKTQTVAAGAAATAPDDPKREGYTFTGWNASFDSVAADMTVTAKYKINTYTVTFKDWDGAVLKTETVKYGGSASAPDAPQRTGYAFTGWNASYDSVAADITVTAKYKINVFTVTFKDWDGTVLKTETVKYGGSASAPDAPQRTGYAFTGWNASYDSVAADMTVTAKYKINTYTVTFKDWDGAVLKTETVKYGDSSAAPDAPQRTGYTFTGWSGGYTDITGDATVTAQYSQNNCTVKFDSNGGSVVANQIVKPGGSVAKPGDPTRNGFTFAGWYADNSLNGAYDFTTAVTANITLFAKWTENGQNLAQDVAQMLTMDKSFQFSGGDTWECVTSNFIMLGIGNDDTKIVWSSSDSSVIRVDQNNGRATGSVTRPQDNDADIVITATVTAGGNSVSKTFLLIVKHQGEEKDGTRQATDRTASVQAGDAGGGAGAAQATIYRTSMSDGKKIDYVNVTADSVQKIIDQGNAQGHVVITIDNDKNNPADEFAFEVSSDTVSTLNSNGFGVTLQSPAGCVAVSPDVMKQAAQTGNSLYFRIAPAKDDARQVEKDFLSDSTVFSVSNSMTGQVFGTPKTIQTNMEGFTTTITLPLEGLSQEQLSDPNFLNTLHIYVRHDDGATELIDGTLTYVNGVPSSIQFTISKYSIFQVVSMNKLGAAAKPTVPHTSLIWIVYIAVIVVLAAVIVLLILLSRKKKRFAAPQA